MIFPLHAVVAQLDRASAFEAEATFTKRRLSALCHEPRHDEQAVALEIASKLRGAGLTLKGGLKESGLFDRVQELYRAGESWESIGKTIGWSPINARECFVLEGGLL